uniref:Uncharacterized protein n=1 Tax=Zea mays TaxID=4577 RepID=A0A804U7F5_MAIZE
MAVHVGSPKPSSPPPPLPPTPRRAALPHPLGPPRRPPTPGLSPPPVLLAPRGRGCRRAQGPRPEGARRPFRPRRVPRRRRGGPPRAPPRARPARRPPCRRRRVPSTPRRGASGFSSAARWKIMEMPSVDWVDVADNWVGGCCTSFGGAGEKLVSQFIRAYGRLEGTSLLDATSITVETDNLETDLVSQCSLGPADGRLRLFKCYTSTEIPVTGPHDVFRGHTLERVFVNLLLEVAEDEISFRTLVRDLKTKRPMLQLVLLSSKAWLSSGCCYENDIDGSHGTTDLQPSVKLLYSDYSNASEADLSRSVGIQISG